tara:strand:- start:38 stop:397 length:360 start_codon:yes stop_codon:yes gene_type:complete
MNTKKQLEKIGYKLIKSYGMSSRIKFSSGKKIKGNYDWKHDIIYLQKRYKNKKELFMSILHEIHHAIQRKKMGWEDFEKKYTQAGNMAVNSGKDFYDDNKYEIRAENWAHNEYKKLGKK